MSVAAVVCFALALWLFWVAAHFSDQNNKLEPALISAYATAAAFLVATAGWLTTNAVSIRAAMRQKSSEFLARRQNDQQLLDALNAIGSFATEHEVLIESGDHDALCRLYLSSESEALRRQLRTGLNFFEETAIFIRRGAADEAILRDFYVGMTYRLDRLYGLIRPALRNIPVQPDHPRGRQSLPELYENLDWLFARWRRYYHDTYLFH